MHTASRVNSTAAGSMKKGAGPNLISPPITPVGVHVRYNASKLRGTTRGSSINGGKWAPGASVVIAFFSRIRQMNNKYTLAKLRLRAFRLPLRSFCSSIEWLEGFHNFERSGVPRRAGTDTADGFDLVGWSIFSRAPPISARISRPLALGRHPIVTFTQPMRRDG